MLKSLEIVEIRIYIERFPLGPRRLPRLHGIFPPDFLLHDRRKIGTDEQLARLLACDAPFPHLRADFLFRRRPLHKDDVRRRDRNSPRKPIPRRNSRKCRLQIGKRDSRTLLPADTSRRPHLLRDVRLRKPRPLPERLHSSSNRPLNNCQRFHFHKTDFTENTPTKKSNLRTKNQKKTPARAGKRLLRPSQSELETPRKRKIKATLALPTTVGTRTSACRRTLATIKPILERKNPCKRKIRTKNQSHTRTPHHGRYAHQRVPANACSDQSNLRTRNAPQAPIVFLLCFL